MKQTAGDTLGRLTQTSSHCAHSWDLCMFISADLTDPSWAVEGSSWSQFAQNSPFWCFINSTLSDSKLHGHLAEGILSTNSVLPHNTTILEIVNKKGHTFVPNRKIQKAPKVPIGHCSFQSVLGQTSLVQVPREGPALRTVFAFTRWIHLLQSTHPALN